MPGGKDIPDWGQSYNNSTFMPLFDDAELAVRLGSVISYDRRGAVFWLDGFEYGLGAWETLLFAPPETFTLDASNWMHPPFSAKATTPAASNSGFALARNLAWPSAGRVGFAVFVNPTTPDSGVHIFINYFIGGQVFSAALQLNGLTDLNLKLVHSGGATVLDNLNDYPSDLGVFNFLKIVVDLDTHKCVRAIFNQTEYDLTAYDMLAEATAKADHMDVKIGLVDLNNNANTWYVDTAVVTAAEPI